MFFWLTVLITTFCILYTFKVRYYNPDKKITRTSVNKLAYVFCAVILALIAGMRSGIGDTGYYMYNFLMYKDYSINELLGMKEPGFKIITKLVGIISDNPQSLLLVCSFFTVILFFKTMYKYSSNLIMSSFLFIASGVYLGTMNGLRQYLVVAVFFACLQLLIDKKFVTYCVICLLLSTIHTSAVLLIPLYFFVTTKPWTNSKLVIIGCLLILFFFATPGLMGWIAGEISTTQYGIYSDSLLSSESNGANILRVGVMVLPAILSFFGRNQFDKNDKYYNLFSNMAVITALFYILTLSNWIFARLAMYTVPFSLLLYPLLMRKIFGKNRKIIIPLFYFLFTIYFIYEIKNITYVSYYLDINTEHIGIMTRGFYQ